MNKEYKRTNIKKITVRSDEVPHSKITMTDGRSRRVPLEYTKQYEGRLKTVSMTLPDDLIKRVCALSNDTGDARSKIYRKAISIGLEVVERQQ